MDTTTDPLADLDARSPEELTKLESDLVAQFDAADEADDLDTMSAVADQINAVRAAAERTGPTDEAPKEGAGEEEAVTAAADETQPETTDPVTADGGESGDSGATTSEATSAEPTPEAQAEGTSDADVETAEPETMEPENPDGSTDTSPPEGDGAENPDAEPGDGNQPEATTAGGESKEGDTVGDIPEKRQPETQPVVASVNEISAGTDIPGWAAGSVFKSGHDVACAFEKRLDTVRRARGGDGTQHVVATITASAVPGRELEPGDVEGNLAKIMQVTQPEAITAAGGFCAPLETRYDIFGTGTTDRPVKAALAGFNARRGGIRYTAAPKIADFAGASGIWTAANDANPATDPGPPETVIPKAEMTVVCQPEVTAVVDAVTLQLKFGNLMTRAYPELIDRNNQLALVAHARFAERNLLNKLTALSTSVTSAFKLGTARDFMNAVGRAAAAYRHRYRMTPTQPLRVLAPVWVRDAVREDLAMQMPGDDTLSVADNIIDKYLRDRNVNASWHLDAPGFPDETAASALDDFPATFDWYIYAEGAFIFLDGGTLDLGIVRDSSLVSTNDYKTFTESFEGVARIGAESIRVTTTTKPAGATAGTVNTTA